MNSNPRITFQRKLYVNRRGASGLVTYTNSYCTQQRKETRPMKTDVTGGHSETQSRSCLCRRSLCKWASLHKLSKVTVWFGAPSLEEPDNEVQFVRLFVCTTNLARPHTGGGHKLVCHGGWSVQFYYIIFLYFIFTLDNYSFIPTCQGIQNLPWRKNCFLLPWWFWKALQDRLERHISDLDPF